MNQNEFEKLATAVTAALIRWPEFAEATGLPATLRNQTSLVHQGLATSLATESSARRT